MILNQDQNKFFYKLVEPLSVREPTKSYLVGIFLQLIKFEISQEKSIVLAYAHACATGRFEQFQSLGDWTTWTMIFVPSLHKENEKIVIELGRKSYETCWRILRGEWDLYAELAENLPLIVESTRNRLLLSKEK